MRENFKRNLQEQSDFAKKELELSSENGETAFKNAEEFAELETELQILLEEGAKEQSGSVAVQESIFSIQKEKQKVMLWLKDSLAALDKKEFIVEEEFSEEEINQQQNFTEEIKNLEVLEEERGVEGFDEEKQVFLYKGKNGEVAEATFGEVVTDLEWDIGYNIEKSENVPRALAKRYLLERAKRMLLKLTDEQIIKSETDNNTVGERTQGAYEDVRYAREIGADKRKVGFVSEIIVRSFLRQLAIDKNLPIQVQEADVYQDIEEKIDFIIDRQTDSTGVKVLEGNEAEHSVAIQFSTNPNMESVKKKQMQRAKRHKRQAGEEVQNMALVIFSKLTAGDLKRQWEKDGRPAGGPGQYMGEMVKKELFDELLQTLFSKEELKEEWRKINGFEEEADVFLNSSDFDEDFLSSGEKAVKENVRGNENGNEGENENRVA